MSDDNRTPERLRRAFELLAAPGGDDRRLDLWAAVAEDFPLSEREAEPNRDSTPRGRTDWLFATSMAVKAGWLLKDGRGGWSITDHGRAALEEHSDPDGFAAAARAGYDRWDRRRREDRMAELSRGILPADENQEAVVRGARLFVKRGLADLDSVFAPGRGVWRTDVTRELVERFVGSDGAVGDNFVAKVAHQLADASDDARLLMAELVALQVLPASTDTIGAAKKAARVESVLALMEHPVQIPPEIREVFDGGSFNPGTRMASNLGAALTILVHFADRWVQQEASERFDLLDDPWAFRAFVNAVPGERFPSQRLALMYLVHPETFTSIVQEQARTNIRDAFIGEVAREPGPDLDRDLRDIWVALQVKHGRPIHFWMPEFLSRWAPAGSPAPVAFDDVQPADRAELEFPAVTEQLADRLIVPRAWLQEVVDLIERRRQIILYGPPGTGKTFLAKAIAAHAAGGREPVIVQFHPSYSYEDFVAGYRPHHDDGGLGYRLKDGPLLRVADAAARNPEQPYFIVIDEINRGNLAKVFGELYFLLEYRDEAIELLYGRDEGDGRMALPANVCFIGTMNTADRSIALLDAAMRRRFAFVELHPDEPPVRDLLRTWLGRHGLGTEAADLLQALNERIDDRDARVGPSYLMPSDLDLSEERLRQVWRYEILPLLEETHFGDGRDIAGEFGLDALRRGRTPRSVDSVRSDGDEADADAE